MKKGYNETIIASKKNRKKMGSGQTNTYNIAIAREI